jgi:hypothetical protein
VSDALKRIETKHIHWATDGTPDVVKLARALDDAISLLRGQVGPKWTERFERTLEEVAGEE